MLHALNSKALRTNESKHGNAKTMACMAGGLLGLHDLSLTFHGSFTDLSRIFRGFSGKNSETEWVLQKALQPFSPLSMHVHCEAFPNVHRQSMSTGTREYLQYQGDFIKRFAQIGWVI